jgi:hypothetical protein
MIIFHGIPQYKKQTLPKAPCIYPFTARYVVVAVFLSISLRRPEVPEVQEHWVLFTLQNTVPSVHNASPTEGIQIFVTQVTNMRSLNQRAREEKSFLSI